MDDLSKLEDLLKKLLSQQSTPTGPAAGGANYQKQLDEFGKSLRKHTDEISKSQPKLKTFSDLMSGNGVRFKDLSGELANLEKQLQEAVEAGDVQKSTILANAKAATQETQVRNVTSQAVMNFGTGLGKVLSDTILTGAIDFVKGLQGGASGVELYGQASKTAARGVTDGLTAVGEVAGTAGVALATVPGPAGTVAKAFAILGPVLSKLAGYFGKVSQEGLDVLNTELKKTQKAFNDASNSGALFADGMTGMRNTAHKAGLSTDQFAEVLKNQSANIAASGLGMTEGIKRLGDVKQIMKKSGIENSLMNLGYGFKEQAELVAEVQANIAKSGAGAGTAEEVAQQTKEYAGNLRLISNLTGEDAKSKLKQVKDQNQILAFQNEVANMSADQRAQIDAAMANMTEADKKALRDRIVNHGVVTNQESALYEATNAGAKAQNEVIYGLVKAGKANAESVATVQGEYADSIKQGARANQAVAVAAANSGSSAAQSIAKSNLDGLNQTTKVNKDTVAAAKKAKEDAEKTADPLTASVNAIESSAQTMKVALEEELGPAITKYSSEMINAAEGVSDMLKRLGLKDKSAGEKTGGVVGGLGGAAAGAAAGAAIGSVVPVLGTLLGGVIGGALGAWGGMELGEKTGGAISGGSEVEKRAKGGPVNAMTPYWVGENGPELFTPKLGGGITPTEDISKMIGDPKSMLGNASSGMGDISGMMSSIKDMGKTMLDVTPAGMVAKAGGSLLDILGGSTNKEVGSVQTADPELLDKLDRLISVMSENKDYTARLMQNMS